MLEDYEDYMETLLEGNKLMAAPGKKLFVRFGTAEAAPEKSSKLSNTYVTHAEFSGSNQNESLTFWSSELHILQQVGGSGTLEAGIRAARARTLTIARQLISRLQHDADNGASCELINGLEDQMPIEPLDLTDINAYGWRLILRFTTTRQDYDPAEWNS